MASPTLQSDQPTAAGGPAVAAPSDGVTGQELGQGHAPAFWRVEGSLLDIGDLRSVRFYIWNTQSYLARWARGSGFALAALLQPLVFASYRIAGTRLLHSLLRGITRDRLDLLGGNHDVLPLWPLGWPAASEKGNAHARGGLPVFRSICGISA